MTGQRVRILLEWWDPGADKGTAEAFAERRQRQLRRLYPGAVAAVYVEENPPPDEVEALSPTAMT